MELLIAMHQAEMPVVFICDIRHGTILALRRIVGCVGLGCSMSANATLLRLEKVNVGMNLGLVGIAQEAGLRKYLMMSASPYDG
jgi:hypothetical protein